MHDPVESYIEYMSKLLPSDYDVLLAHKALMHYRAMKEALFDLCDGNDWYDIKYTTGMSDERCQEIIDLARKE